MTRQCPAHVDEFIRNVKLVTVARTLQNKIDVICLGLNFTYTNLSINDRNDQIQRNFFKKLQKNLATVSIFYFILNSSEKCVRVFGMFVLNDNDILRKV